MIHFFKDNFSSFKYAYAECDTLKKLLVRLKLHSELIEEIVLAEDFVDSHVFGSLGVIYSIKLELT